MLTKPLSDLLEEFDELKIKIKKETHIGNKLELHDDLEDLYVEIHLKLLFSEAVIYSICETIKEND